MNVYLVYDKKTGRILHMVSKYVIGNSEPVPMTPDEVLAEVSESTKAAEVGITAVPEEFDPRDRGKRLAVEPANGVARITAAPLRQPRTGSKKGGKK
jgi:hypothetical protein